MTPEMVMTVGRHALEMTLMLAAPLLLTALAVGLIVGIFQAATQINEMTLSFIPKLLAMAAVLAIAGPWMMPHAGRVHARAHRKHSRADRLTTDEPIDALTTGQLEGWVAQGFFPFVRIGACLMVAPVFGARFVPPRTRIVARRGDHRAGRAADSARRPSRRSRRRASSWWSSSCSSAWRSASRCR